MLTGQETTFVKQELTDVVAKQRPRGDVLSKIFASVELDGVQRQSPHGLEFVLDIFNGGTQAVELLDPVEFTSILLKNSDELPVQLPNVPSVFVVNTRDPQAFIARWEPRRPFHAIEIGAHRRRRSIKSVGDVVGDVVGNVVDGVDDGGKKRCAVLGKVRLEPNGHFQVILGVSHVLADPVKFRDDCSDRFAGRLERNTPLEEEAAMARIPLGTYKLQVSLLVGLGTGDPTGTDAPPSRSLRSEWITVELTRN